ncbi:uncharacterized protein LOC122262198 [Penaeus japonicus]|uniref:uncharacterized protein LOC122262198 n=1 Tax=Penaeus japonicus TaxID=27405 RepID=UPI001C70E610|nr:uncharacterized protein LOC122262198 [Penaeus japonicus]
MMQGSEPWLLLLLLVGICTVAMGADREQAAAGRIRRTSNQQANPCEGLCVQRDSLTQCRRAEGLCEKDLVCCRQKISRRGARHNRKNAKKTKKNENEPRVDKVTEENLIQENLIREKLQNLRSVYEGDGTVPCKCRHQPVPANEYAVEMSCTELSNVTGMYGFVVSPAYPDNYGHNRDCTLDIWSTHGTRIVITWLDFHLQHSRQCKKDSVTVTDYDSSGKAIDSHAMCGCGIRERIVFTSNHVRLQLRSDGQKDYCGFEFFWHSIYKE